MEALGGGLAANVGPGKPLTPHSFSGQRHLELVPLQPLLFEVPRQSGDNTGAARRPDPGRRAPSLQRPRTPAPGPTRPATSAPARPSPSPGTIPSPTQAPGGGRGRRAHGSPACWIPGRLGGAGGAGERGPQTQTLLLSGLRSRHFLAELAARPGL
ncbi:uncharacterized protein LOC144330367 [Macaca mulatta]